MIFFTNSQADYEVKINVVVFSTLNKKTFPKVNWQIHTKRVGFDQIWAPQKGHYGKCELWTWNWTNNFNLRNLIPRDQDKMILSLTSVKQLGKYFGKISKFNFTKVQFFCSCS